MKNRPPYAIDSVDNALLLAQVLQAEGRLRVTDAAERLGVSASTAHRLLAMLVYRDFAERSANRDYVPGRMLRPAPVSEAPLALLRRVAGPHMRALSDRIQESSNLMVLVGTEVRFIATAECSRPLRVGDRMGQALPAHRTSGGKALLATLPPEQVTSMFGSLPEADLRRLRRELGLVRRRGFGINDQLTETGVTAFGVAIRDAGGAPVAALSVAMPTARFDRDRLAGWVTELSAVATLIERELGRLNNS
ncbi:DNA-binding IclR family transcriptional regulator [Kibdelosporangium banguiense]|uniref:DNA-binding IclR family transcriptional regulator n=1 Tax=Kibdelosporangium banguiense TaxID=1365924 RepID=A0ABS4TRG9_9PSEU|nr:IclR family transcriptional regulator [Kibdelosporangium banguiense]MBP2327003.1 DNA-binding IclR family transcriptional regulator [Kibdelosporangium banguiense]